MRRAMAIGAALGAGVGLSIALRLVTELLATDDGWSDRLVPILRPYSADELPPELLALAERLEEEHTGLAFMHLPTREAERIPAGRTWPDGHWCRDGRLLVRGELRPCGDGSHEPLDLHDRQGPHR